MQEEKTLFKLSNLAPVPLTIPEYISIFYDHIIM